MSKAFLDTSILTDALLNSGVRRDAAVGLVNSYVEREICEVVVKEFKAGPLTYFKWMHNKLALLRNVPAAMAALQAIGRQRNRQSTAIQAIAVASEGLSKLTMGQLAAKYGDAADPNTVYADALRVELKVKIMLAWEDRQALATKYSHPLSCYHLSAPVVAKNGQIDLAPVVCDKGNECCLKKFLISDLSKLNAVTAAIAAQPSKPENEKRLKVLKDLIAKGDKHKLDRQACIALGDATIDLLAPHDADILTSNVQDHGPIAAALGKVVKSHLP